MEKVMKQANCDICMKWLQLRQVHGEGGCPIQASMWCSQCGCYGHRPDDCEKHIMWKRPRNLEDLIPHDVRERWDIDTETPIVWLTPSLYDAEREIPNINTIFLHYREGRMDGKIREFMKANKIPTVHKMDGNLMRLREWAVFHGKKLCLQQDL
jgi:hypothetical protein